MEANTLQKKADDELKEKIEEFFKIPCRTKGVAIIALWQYIESTHGKEKIKEAEEILAQAGSPFKISELQPFEWYPVGILPAHYLVIQKILGWGEQEVEKANKQAVKFSLIEKLFGRYFLSPEKTYQMASRVWRKHFDVGKLEAPEINIKDKYFILKLKDFKTSSLHCAGIRGWFQGVALLVLKDTEKISCQETKCVFRGDPYHEFIIYWK